MIPCHVCVARASNADVVEHGKKHQGKVDSSPHKVPSFVGKT